MSTVTYPTKLLEEFPYIDKSKLTRRMMIHLLVALSFPAAAGFYYFGIAMIRAIIICITVCVLTEWGLNKLMKQESTVSDLTAVSTGFIIALNMRPGIGLYPLLLSCIVGMAVGKMIFGGVGFNPVNPAVVGRLVPVAGFPGLWATAIRPTIPNLMEHAGLTYWEANLYISVSDEKTLPFYNKVLEAQPAYNLYSFTDKLNTNYDVLSGTTYLETIKSWYKSGVMPEGINSPTDFFDYWTLFVGNMPGTLGETAKWAILLGFIYLVVTKVMSPLVPMMIWGFMALFGWTFAATRLGPIGVGPLGFFAGDPMIWVLAGGAMLGSVYMETDPVTSPRSLTAKILYSLFFVTVVTSIRLMFSFPEGVSFALLSSNLVLPFIDKLCNPKAPYAAKVNKGLRMSAIAAVLVFVSLGIYKTVIATPIYEQNIQNALRGQEYTKIQKDTLNTGVLYYTLLDANNNVIGKAFNVFDQDNLGELIGTTVILSEEGTVLGFAIVDAPNKPSNVPQLAPNAEFQQQYIGKTQDELASISPESDTEFTPQMAQLLIQKAFDANATL